jgi:NAD+ kinase
MAMPIDLVLVRHEFSEANWVQKQIKQDPSYQKPEGFFDRHDSEMRLHKSGADRAPLTGEWLRKEFPDGFDRYYVSPHARTVETAGLLALKGSWLVDDRWRERDWGEYGILNDEEREERYELAHKLKKQNKWYWCPPGGESLGTGVRLRVEDILDSLHRGKDEKQEERVIGVAHGEMNDVFKFVLERMTPIEWLEQDADSDYKVSNCQVLNYTRRDPITGTIAPKIFWRRCINAWDPERSWDNGQWTDVEYKQYSDDELLKLASQFPRLLNND